MISELHPALLFGLSFFGWATMNSIDLTYAFGENSNWLKFTPDQVIDFKPGDSQAIVNFEECVERVLVLNLLLVPFDWYGFFLSFQYQTRGLGFMDFERFDLLKNFHQFMAPITITLRLELQLKAPYYHLYKNRWAFFQSISFMQPLLKENSSTCFWRFQIQSLQETSLLQWIQPNFFWYFSWFDACFTSSFY